jgi:excinuclease UvrABC helicase subunit UvrB
LTLVLSHIDDVAERRRKEIKLSSDHYNELTGINQQLTTELTAITKRNENVRSDLVKAYLPMVNSKKRRIEELTHEVSSLKKTVQFNEGDGFSDDSDGR